MSVNKILPVAIIVLNYETDTMTDSLAEYLRTRLDYPEKDVYVIDNGSNIIPKSTSFRFAKNIGFTRGFTEALNKVRSKGNYEAFWLLNSDVLFNYGNNVLTTLVHILFSNTKIAQIAPRHDSAHGFMRHPSSNVMRTPYIEPTATLIRASTLNKVGFWDAELSLGWGVDYDYGFRVRQSGLCNVVTSSARLRHLRHISTKNRVLYVQQAQAEMQRVLSQKYGSNWRQILEVDQKKWTTSY